MLKRMAAEIRSSLALRFFERWSCRAADQLIATNQTQRSTQISRCGVPAERTNIVRNGPRLDDDDGAQPLARLRPPGRTVIGYMGRIGFQDGVDGLLRAVHRLRTRTWPRRLLDGHYW